MAQVAPNIEERQEFWKPVIPPRQETEQEPEVAVHACGNCGTDLVAGAKFCHACGTMEQTPAAEFTESAEHQWYDLTSLLDALDQTTPSLVAFILGCACVIAAVFTGFMFTATTLLDWQAVQIWRIEWLLAALAMFAAGLLLKKK
jgi:hypothetical protein